MSFLKEIAEVEYGKSLPERARKPGTTKVYGSAGEVGSHIEPLYNEPIIVVGRKGNISGVHKVDGPSWVIDTAYAIKAKSAVERDYLFYFLKYNTAHLAQNDQSTAVPSLAREVLFNLEVKPPEIEIQKRIVKKIESLFAEVDLATRELQKSKQQLELYKQSVLNSAIQGKLVPQDPRDEPASTLLEKIAKKRLELLAAAYPNKDEAKSQSTKQKKQKMPSGLPKLPQGWTWATLMQCSALVVDCHNKTAPYEKSGIPLLRTTNIRNGKIDLSETKFISESTYQRWSARCQPEPGDILITREAPMGEVGIIPDGVKVCMGQRMMLIRLIPGTIEPKFFLYSLMDPDFMGRVQDKPVGATVQHIRVGGVETMLIPLPPQAEQQRIQEKIEAALKIYDEASAVITEELKRVCMLQQSILKSAFEGKLL